MYYWKSAASVLILSRALYGTGYIGINLPSKLTKQINYYLFPVTRGQLIEVCTASDKNKTWVVAKLLVHIYKTLCMTLVK